jgi:TolB-like protein
LTGQAAGSPVPATFNFVVQTQESSMSDGATPGPGSEPQGAAEGDLERERRKELKARRKLRAAWISFVGRIVAQVIGAAATVTLGLLIAHRIHRAETAPPPPVVATPAPARVPAHGVAIAVLPLDNFSGDPARDHLADGLTEALIADLTKAGGLHVVSRTSVMQYKGTRKPLPQIARELGVEMVIEGSVVLAGDRARVTAQLVHARDDRHLWSEVYDRDLRDVLALQSDVAHRVSREVRALLGGPAGSVPADVRAVEGDRPRLAAVGGALPELPQASPGQR